MMNTADLSHLILVLIGGLKAVEDERVEGGVFREIELGEFVLDTKFGEGRLSRQDVAECDAVIVGADFEDKLSACVILQVNVCGVVVVADAARLANGNGVCVLDDARLHVDLAHARSESGLPLELETQRTLVHKPFSVEIH